METKLLKTARECGCKVLGGLSMLVWQAAASHKIWDGSQYTYDEIAALCERDKAGAAPRFPGVTGAMAQTKLNIVLCGFMGCGKSTVGKKLPR